MDVRGDRHNSIGFCENFIYLIDEYFMTCKTITLPCISFMFIKMKFIHYDSCVIFTMKSMSICND